jgi:hypothetical protein
MAITRVLLPEATVGHAYCTEVPVYVGQYKLNGLEPFLVRERRVDESLPGEQVGGVRRVKVLTLPTGACNFQERTLEFGEEHMWLRLQDLGELSR